MGFSKGLQSELDWDVVKNPLTYGGDQTEVENFYALNRNDNGNLITIHKDSYHPIYNREFTDFVEQFSESTKLPISGYSEYNGGNIILAFLENETNFEINGNEMREYMVIGNSHDKSTSAFIGTSTELIRCTNAFSKIMKQGVIRHTANKDERLKDILQQYSFYFKQREILFDGMRKMKDHVVSSDLRASLVDNILDIKDRKELSTRKSNILSELNGSIDTEFNDLGENLWGFFNGVTHYTTHKMNSKKKSDSAIVGPNYTINKNMHELCLKELQTA